MKLSYFEEADSLYIDLFEWEGVESLEVSEGVALDYDEKGALAGIDVDNASQKVQLKELTLNRIPGEVRSFAV